MRKQESGSVLTFAIIAIVIIILGIVGFVLWHNFLKPTTTSETSQTSASPTTSETQDPSVSLTKTITISEWGVKGQYTGDTSYTYAYIKPEGLYKGGVYLKHPDLPADCDEYTGVIRAWDANDIMPESTGYPSGQSVKEFYDSRANDSESNDYQHKLGDRYFFYFEPNSLCPNVGENEYYQALQTNMIQTTRQLLSTLENI